MPGMTEPLGYAPPIPRYRRVGFVAVTTIPILIASYFLAIPKIQTFRDHQARRADARRQFETQVSTARRQMDALNLDGAAAALFNAEFPIQLERHLFSRAAQSDLDRVLAGLRRWIDQAIANR